MQCPVCDNTALQMSERKGVEIDYCPKCRGIWLDRGELDKIIEHSQQDTAQSQEARHQSYEQSQGQSNHQRKKSSFLGDLFDF